MNFKENILAKRRNEREHGKGKPLNIYELIEYIAIQKEWSKKTFGPGPRTKGIIEHIRKELVEIEKAPSDLSEWIDIIILAIDGAWRTDAIALQIVQALELEAKQAKNLAREWLDWRKFSQDEAIEHVRENEEQPTAQKLFDTSPSLVRAPAEIIKEVKWCIDNGGTTREALMFKCLLFLMTGENYEAHT